MQDHYRQPIRAFLMRHMPDYDLQDNEDIFATGFVTSLFVVQLVLFIEKTCHITLSRSDLNNDNLRSVNAIMALLDRKLAPQGTGPTA
ncbi:MAG TPA: acyl carrier protein [Herpetosiphonaceae bacterium]